MKITKNYLRKLIAEAIADQEDYTDDPEADPLYGLTAVENGITQIKSGLQDVIPKNNRDQELTQKFNRMSQLITEIETLYGQVKR